MTIQFADLFALIQKEASLVDPTMHIQVKGTRFEGGEEWIVFNDLAVYPMPSRKKAVDWTLFLEIICYSKQAGDREDGKFKRAWEIAQNYFDRFNQARLTVESSCIQFKEARLIDLSLHSLGDFAQGIDQQSPSLQLDAILMEVEGKISQSKGL